MAKANTEEVKQEEQKQEEQKQEEMVMIRLPLDKHHKKDLFVGVNGRTWQIQRGVNVMVPLCVKEVIENSEAMQNEALAYEEAMQAELENMARGVVK